MKVVRLQVLPAALLTMLFGAAAYAADTETSKAVKPPPYSKQALQSKIEFCQTCHGPSAEGALGPLPIPRLAGQQTKYLENQLANFMVRRRQSDVMSVAAHDMSPALVTALATYFSALNPKPLGGGPAELVITGKNIYNEGVLEAKVPACAGCHGPEAKGDGPFPRLAGQVYDYVSSKMKNWENERGQNPAVPDKSASIMQPVAHNLTEAQIAAVAAYLANLE